MSQNRRVNDASRNQRSSDISQNRKVNDMSQNRSVSNMSQNRSVSDMSQNRNVSDISQDRRVNDMSQNRKVSDISQNLSDISQSPSVNDMSQNRRSIDQSKNPSVNDMSLNRRSIDQSQNRSFNDMVQNRRVHVTVQGAPNSDTSSSRSIDRTSIAGKAEFDTPCNASCLKMHLRRARSIIYLFMAVVLATVTGVILRKIRIEKWTEEEIMYMNFPGEVFIRAIKVMIVPVVISSVVSAIGGLETKTSEKIAVRAAVFFISSTFISVCIGATIVQLIAPGEYGRKKVDFKFFKGIMPVLDIIRNIVPDNIVEACFEMTETRWISEENFTGGHDKNSSFLPDKDSQSFGLKRLNVLGLLTFGLAFALAVNRSGERAQVVHNFFVGANAAIVMMIEWVIQFMPFGVFFLITAKVLSTEDSVLLLKRIGLFSASIVTALLTQFFFTHTLMYTIFLRKNPFRFLRGQCEALTHAFTSCSSMKTLPVTIRCAVQKNKMKTELAHLVFPIGTTISKDGTAMYEIISTIFIAQMNSKNLKFHDILLAALTTCLAAISTCGLPGAAIVSVLMVLDAENLPANDISLLMFLDWFLDRFVTVTNVWGVSVVTAIIEKLSGKDIDEVRLIRRSRGIFSRVDTYETVAKLDRVTSTERNPHL